MDLPAVLGLRSAATAAAAAVILWQPIVARAAEPTPLSDAITGRRGGSAAPTGGLGENSPLVRKLFAHRAVRHAVPIAGDIDVTSQRAPGDQLVIHKDDDQTLVPFSLEGRLAVSPCVAGPTDLLAFRFATLDFARQLPVHVAGIEIGFDNRYGRTTWPSIGVALEDPAQPLRPLATLADAVADFADPLTMLAAPAGGVADDFMRLRVALPTGVDVVEGLTIDDGMWSDDFARAVDEPLDNPSSEWLECSLIGCAPSRLLAESQAVRKTAAGDAIGIKLASAAIDAIRPVRDRDLAISVDYDVTDAAAARAGVVFRLQALDQFYLAEYRSVAGVDEVVLVAETPSGPVQLDAAVINPAQPRGTLEIVVTGAHPTTHIEVGLGGAAVITHDDGTYAFTGTYLGLASLGPSSNEVWDNLVVRRNADVFAVVQLPPGEDAGLVTELSASSFPFSNVLTSSDGLSFAPLATGAGCVRNPGGLVGLEIADTTTDGIDNVFLREAKMTTLELTCATCAVGQSACGENAGSVDATSPAYEVGQSIDVNVRWWNEHVPDLSDLMFRFLAFDLPCDLVGAVNPAPIAAADVVPVVVPGQGSGGAISSTLALPGLSFTPTIAGEHCVFVLEHYDTNGDACPDGWEGAPCPAGCTCIGDPDDNVATGIIGMTVRVEISCVEGVSQLTTNSLRVAPDVDPTLSVLSWLSGGPPASYNLHVTDDKQRVQDPRIRDDVPVWRTVASALTLTEALGTDCTGIHFVGVHERDTCPSGRSLPDP